MSTLYNSFLRNGLTGSINISTDTFKLMLVTSGYSPNKDHAFRSDVTNEASGAGYTAGGVVAAISVATDNTNDRCVISLDAPLSWSSATVSANGFVIYKSRGGSANADELVCHVSFAEGTVGVTNGTFNVPAQATMIVASQT